MKKSKKISKVIWKQNSEEIFNSVYCYLDTDKERTWIESNLRKLWYEKVFPTHINIITNQILDPLVKNFI